MSDFDLHELITGASHSYSLSRVTLSNGAQDGGSYLQTIATGDWRSADGSDLGPAWRKERCLSRPSGASALLTVGPRWHACLPELDESKVFRIDYVFTSPSVSVLFMDTSHVMTTDRHP